MERAAVMKNLRPAVGALGWFALLALVLPLACYVLGLSPAPCGSYHERISD